MRSIAVCLLFLVHATLSAQTPTPSTTSTAAVPDKSVWESRAIIGWHQAGASSAKSEQHLFIDFFVARPLASGPVYNSPFSLWGQVRIASSPQQKTIPLSQFAIDFVQELGSVPVNELAQSGEFLTGIEWHPEELVWKGDRVRTLSFVAAFGANGSFSDPTTQGRVFRVPPVSSPQWANFVHNFPEFQDAAFRANAQFIGLVPQDRERFYRQYGAGIRYASFAKESPGDAPSMYTATIGQDQAITRGRYAGAVLKFDAFYKLPLDKATFIYFFGTANLAVTKPRAITPLALELVSNDCASTAPASDQGLKCGVKLFQDNVAIFALPSARDTYRVGVGIDIIAFLRKTIDHKD